MVAGLRGQTGALAVNLAQMAQNYAVAPVTTLVQVMGEASAQAAPTR